MLSSIAEPTEKPGALEDEPAAGCPLPQTRGRLRQAHRLWHLLHTAYPDADDFVLQLNAAVEGFRNVTFILQNEMGAVIPDAESWYAPWQDEMRQDAVMKWLHDSRTKVVHQGDLVTHSTARVSVRASWYGSAPLAEMEVPPLVPPEAIAASVAETIEVPATLQKEGVLEVERRWVEDGLPDWELLDALAHCYGVLSQILADAHSSAGYTMAAVSEHGGGTEPVAAEHLQGRLPCMVVSREHLTARMHLGTGEFLDYRAETVSFDSSIGEEGRVRYTLDDLLERGRQLQQAQAQAPTDEGFLEIADIYAEIAKRILVSDKRHITLAMLHGPKGPAGMLRLARIVHEAAAAPMVGAAELSA